LLESGRVNPNTQDLTGRTPISYAAGWGNYLAVEMLLRYGAQPDKKDKKGRTALWWNKHAHKRYSMTTPSPRYRYHHAFLKIEDSLKGREDVDPNPKDNDGLEPGDPSLHEMNLREGNI
jgi:hypothetical protein